MAFSLFQERYILSVSSCFLSVLVLLAVSILYSFILYSSSNSEVKWGIGIRHHAGSGVSMIKLYTLSTGISVVSGTYDQDIIIIATSFQAMRGYLGVHWQSCFSQGNSRRNRRGKSPIQFIQRGRSVFLPRPLHPTLPDCCVPGEV